MIHLAKIYKIISLVSIFKMKYNKIQITDRQRVFAAHEDEKDWKVLARTLEDYGTFLASPPRRTSQSKTSRNQPPHSYFHWLEYKQDTPKKREKATSKNIEDAVELCKSVADSAVTLPQLQQNLTPEIDLNVTLNTIKNWLDCKL